MGSASRRRMNRAGTEVMAEAAVGNAMSQLGGLDEKLDALYKQYAPDKVKDVVDKIHKQTGLPHYVVCLLGIICLYMMVSRLQELLCNLIGFLFPAYKSIKALEQTDKQKVTKWLTYWTVFSALSVLDFFVSHLIVFIPGYFIFKAIFLVWCFLPIERNGSVVVYENILKPYFKRLQARIDNNNSS